MALLLRLNRRRATSSRTLFFSTSNSDSNSDSNSPFSSLFIDVKESLKQPSSPSSNPRSQPPFANEILKNLSEFGAKTGPPPPGDPSQQQQQFSFQQIYQRQTVQGNPPRSGESSSPSMESIFGSLRNLSVAQTPVSQAPPISFDVHSRKGLVAMVQMRKRLLKYLRRTDWDSYCFVISKLGLRDNPDHSYRSRTSMAT